MIISDTSPLILLARISRLKLLEELYRKVHIPYEVYNEAVVNGKREYYGDAALIENGINEFIFVQTLNSQYKQEANRLKRVIGSGESEAIAMCLQEKAKMLLIDDLEPKKLAQSKNINCRTTPGILLEGLKGGILTFHEYESSIMELSRYAWLSGDVVAYFLEAGYKLKKAKQGEPK